MTPLEASTIPSKNPPGRFQLAMYHTTAKIIFMIDTCTGRTWVSDATEPGWQEAGTPSVPVTPDE